MPHEKMARSKALLARAERLIPGASQTNSKRPRRDCLDQVPAFIERGEGCHVWDVDGHEYVDYIMALGPILLGYRHPAVEEAVREAMDLGVVFGLPHPLEVDAAEAVVRTVPCAEQVRFLKSGAEATSAAVRIARACTGREVVLSCGYHGWHDNWTAMRNDGGVPHCLEDLVHSFPYNSTDALKSALEEYKGKVAAVIMVPAQVEHPKENYLQTAASLARDAGALLVFDEIVTGFRLALGGGQERFQVVPDLAAFAKGMANGYPIAAVVGRSEYMERAEELLITTTYGGEIHSLAALKGCVQFLESNPPYEGMARLGEELMRGTKDAARSSGVDAELIGFEVMPQLIIRGGSSERTSNMWRVFLGEAAQRGVLLREGGLLFITPSHTEEDIERTICAFEAAFQAADKA